LGAAYRVLSALAERGVNLLAFTAVPSGVDRAQFAIFPDDPSRFVTEARLAQIEVDGPHHALLVQGDDELGGLAHVHERLLKAGVDVYASTGVSDAAAPSVHRVRPRGPVRTQSGAQALTRREGGCGRLSRRTLGRKVDPALGLRPAVGLW
jgi:hypothetical protein